MADYEHSTTAGTIATLPDPPRRRARANLYAFDLYCLRHGKVERVGLAAQSLHTFDSLLLIQRKMERVGSADRRSALAGLTKRLALAQADLGGAGPAPLSQPSSPAQLSGRRRPSSTPARRRSFRTTVDSLLAPGRSPSPTAGPTTLR
jgi:hypothetical protein